MIQTAEISPSTFSRKDSIKQTRIRTRSHRTLSEEIEDNPDLQASKFNLLDEKVSIFHFKYSLLTTFFTKRYIASNCSPPASSPSPGDALLTSSQHSSSKSNQHLHLPSTQQFGGRLRRRRTQHPRGRSEPGRLHGNTVAQASYGQHQKSLVAGVDAHPRPQRETERFYGAERHHGCRAAHPDITASHQHGEGQR